MREYECIDCHERFAQPKEGQFLTCPKCDSTSILPVTLEKGPMKATPKQRKQRRGAQMALFGKEET